MLVPTLLAMVACTGSSDTGDSADTGDCRVFTWYRDEDGDGHGNPDFPSDSCDSPKDFSPEPDDCDDTDKTKWNDCPGWDCISLGTYDHPVPDTEGPQTRSTYQGCTLEVGWQEARQRCYDAWPGSDLADTLEQDEFLALQELAANLDTDGTYWFGIKQETTAPSIDFGWFFVDAGYPDNKDVESGGIWHVGQPDNGGYEENAGGDLDEDVAVFYAVDGIWGVGDDTTSSSWGYVCEVPQTL
jgi:hypothetical protein